MSYGTQQTDQYLQNEILSRPKEHLTPLLFEHLISRLKRGKVLIEVSLASREGEAPIDWAAETARRAAWVESLSKAQQIVFYLHSTLEPDDDSELKAQMSPLFDTFTFWQTELVAIQCDKAPDPSRIAPLIEMAEELRVAFVQAAEQLSPSNRGRLASASA